jgi:hypothetical protein
VVAGTESDSSGLAVLLEAGSLVLNPTATELAGPEIAMLHVLGEPGEWMVWRPGEDTFRHLA